MNPQDVGVERPVRFHEDRQRWDSAGLRDFDCSVLRQCAGRHRDLCTAATRDGAAGRADSGRRRIATTTSTAGGKIEQKKNGSDATDAGGDVHEKLLKELNWVARRSPILDKAGSLGFRMFINFSSTGAITVCAMLV